MLNPFDICVVDRSNNMIYRKDNIKDCINYKDSMVLLELKNKFNSRKLKIGDVFLDAKEMKYYIFTLTKNEYDLDLTAISGFGFFIFERSIDSSGDFELINGVHVFKDKKLNYVCNLFLNKDYAESVIVSDYFNKYFDYLYKLNDVTFYIKFSSTRKRIFHTFMKLTEPYVDAIDEMKRTNIDFKFNIFYYQKLFSKPTDMKSGMTNCSLFYIRDTSKNYFSVKGNLKYEVFNGNHLNYSGKHELLLDNIIPFFEKFFVFIDSIDGIVKLKTLNRNLADSEIDYTNYLAVTMQHFIVVEDNNLINQELLNLIHLY